MSYMEQLGENAVKAKRSIATAKAEEKNAILRKIAEVLRENTDLILAENQKDIDREVKKGIRDVMVDRLRLSKERIDAMADSCLELVALNDPVGEVISGEVRPNGMQVTRVRVPLGVVGIIYESRPNVTVDAAALCLKSGNAVILRGGREAIFSNLILGKLLQEAIFSCGFPRQIVQVVEDTDRAVATELMRLNNYIDVLIPRGGAGLIQSVVQNSTVPVIETGTGNCHIYIDETADIDMAVKITNNGKTQRPSVCNALETCLVHESVASEFLPKLALAFAPKQVQILGCERTRKILGNHIVLATKEDYATEFLDYIISVKVVDSVDEAIAHIARYSSGHSECIVTNNYNHAKQFQQEVDSACVYVNCSTRFTDGGQLGMGAEIGISTQKLHVRGPMGLSDLTAQKYLISGDGQIR